MASDVKTLLDPPAAGQKVSHSGKIYTTIQEGRAYILVPETTTDGKVQDDKKNATNNAGPVQQVFYNPIQQFNRDLTILAIKAYGEEVVEKRKQVLEQRLEKQKNKRKRHELKKGIEKAEKDVGDANADEVPSTEDDAGKKRKRDEDGPEKDANKVAKPGDTTSPQEAKASAGVTEVGDAMDITEENGTHSGNVPPEAQDGQENEGGEGKEGETKGDSILPPFTILDALSASGLRALRYAHEIPFVSKVTANDLDPSAAEAISRNAKHNSLEHAIEVTQGDALVHMYTKIAANSALTEKQKQKGRSEKYDVVDLDPYGTAATFFDAAVQAVREDGGLLCVTCTDAGVWASNGYPEKCFALYGGVPIKGWHGHEVGLRLILNGLAMSAARYGLNIEPLLSLSIDFYARVFVKIKKSPAAVKFAAGKTMMVYNCDAGCGAWSTQLLLKNRVHPNKKGSGTFYKHQLTHAPTVDQSCEHCGTKMHIAGPMYAGRIHNPEFVKRILDKLPEADKSVYKTTDRIRGMLTTALEEHMEEAGTADESKLKSQDDEYAEVEPYPFFFLPTQLARIVHCATPSEDAIRSALEGLGYRVTRSHCKPGSIKTDAPWSVLWHVIREWIKQKAPIKVENIKAGSPGYRILGLDAAEREKKTENGEESDTKDKDAKEDTKPEVVFNMNLSREKGKEKLVRYQMNPRENWGPMNRARS